MACIRDDIPRRVGSPGDPCPLECRPNQPIDAGRTRFSLFTRGTLFTGVTLLPLGTGRAGLSFGTRRARSTGIAFVTLFATVTLIPLVSRRTPHGNVIPIGRIRRLMIGMGNQTDEQVARFRNRIPRRVGDTIRPDTFECGAQINGGATLDDSGIENCVENIHA
ncbi:MAG: hypothetical protein H7835_17095 [Magnetococcus sp. XQGC-1]